METPSPAPPARTTAPPPSAPSALAPRAAPTRSFHDFTPSLHGFQFRNGFEGFVLGFSGFAYGFCGGMFFVAVDYFFARREPPRDSKAPADGTPLYNYLYSRQATSFGTLGSMGLKFVEWMQLPDDGADSAHSRTLAQLPTITAALSRGDPVVLGLVLVRASDKANASDNHQVLAFAEVPPVAGSERPVSSPPTTPSTTLRIYDSNFPQRDDITIEIAQGDRTTIAMHIPGRRDIPIRGFFRMAYSPALPP